VVSIADEGEPEIVIDVPEDQLAGFKKARFKASLPSESDEDPVIVLGEVHEEKQPPLQ